MSKLLSEEIVEAVTLGDKEGFMSAFHSALAAKVSDALELKKVEIASTLVAPASNEVVEEEVELDESRGAEKLGDMLDSDADQETKLKRIAIAPTAHLKYLHKYNMGQSGGGDHPMVKHIKNELNNRKMKNEEVNYEEVEHLDEDALKAREHWMKAKSVPSKDPKADRARRVKRLMQTFPIKNEQVELDEAAKPDAKGLKVSFGKTHSGQPGGDGQSDKVITHHDNGVKVTSAIGWDGDHHIDVHHDGKHVGGIFSTHGYGVNDYQKNEKYKGGIGHKEVKAAMNAHQKHPEVQSWLIHNHPDSESEADSGTINGHKLHPTAEKYLEKISNDDNRDYEAPYKPQTSSAVKPKPASKASTSSAYEKALAALKKKHGINEEVEQIDELSGREGGILDRYLTAVDRLNPGKTQPNSAPDPRLAGRRMARKKLVQKPGYRQGFEKAHPTAASQRLHGVDQNQPVKVLATKSFARNEEVQDIEEAKGETRISWRARTPEEIAKSDKRCKVKITSAELEARAKARRAEKSE